MGKKTYIDKKGYPRYKDSGKLVHRVVMSKVLKRPLKDEEVVHHKDRNKKNNSLDNLWVYPNQKEHDKTHKSDARKFGKSFSYKGRKRKKY